MTIFQHCRKVVTGSCGLEKASELARHRTTERHYLLWTPVTVGPRTSIAGAASTGGGRHYG